MSDQANPAFSEQAKLLYCIIPNIPALSIKSYGRSSVATASTWGQSKLYTEPKGDDTLPGPPGADIPRSVNMEAILVPGSPRDKDEEAWDLTFSKRETQDCKGSLGKASGYGKTACSNNIPKGANSVNGTIPKGNWNACLYLHEDCKTTGVPPGNEVFALWFEDGCESFKSKKEFSSFLVANGIMCPWS
ncbi:hypothetical protein F53441_14589 [Fusarium austroafricanum]|uniref:Uncharacterized protein n=1 Tax=Fusarium austroafricanum TaxID=2364996 RepID=A0A8H4JA57_9HYPO|nr:hypothetical protein F53441_14589 [Fusarium austroafricanum]